MHIRTTTDPVSIHMSQTLAIIPAFMKVMAKMAWRYTLTMKRIKKSIWKWN